VSASPTMTQAWVLHRGDSAGLPGVLVQEEMQVPTLPSEGVLVRPLYGAWEANIDHALRRSPVDVCELRGEDRVVLGNAGVVEVLATGAQVETVRPGSLAIVFCNGEPDAYGYPQRIFGYDAPGTIGVLAKRTVLHQKQVIALPAATPLSLPQWAAFSLRYVTAWANWRVAWGCFRTQMPDIDPEDVHVWGWGGGVALAELTLARSFGCRATMVTSKPERVAQLRTLDIQAIDRSAFRPGHQEEDFLSVVREQTASNGIHIMIDNLGVLPGATLKALARQGVIATSGWKHRTVFPIARTNECQNRHLHVFTHYARYEEGLAAVDFAVRHGWAPPVDDQIYAWEEIPRLARDYAAGEIDSYFPIFRVNASEPVAVREPA
jgi:NADPH:quinone reductase-like Zn-dependent oxidoreductase